MNKITIVLLILAAFALSCHRKSLSTGSTENKKVPGSVEWIRFEDLAAAQIKEPRKVFIDVYTDWCGWCKKMDAQSLTHPVIVKYLGTKFYAVKFNAETKDTIRFNGHTYTSTNPGGARATHQLALSLLNNKLGYPTTVYLDEDLKMLGPLQGFLDPKTLEAVLHYYGDEAYKTTPWPTFQETFTGEIQ
ncbi:MAG: DUF255 domain-containing protein [Bacteroidia bacterium]|nr:DUF255 domain-containing protein [Bacteroidia bacterium]